MGSDFLKGVLYFMDKNEKIASELLKSEPEFITVKKSFFVKIIEKIVKIKIIKDLKEIEENNNG